MEPVATTGLINEVAKQGALAAFMLLVIIVLVMAVKMLFDNNRDQGKENTKALIDSTVAINNNTAALAMLGKQIERLENHAG